MKIKEGYGASTKQFYELPVGSCFKLHDKYYIKTVISNSVTSCTCINLSNGDTTSISDYTEVYPVDATIVINKVGE